MTALIGHFLTKGYEEHTPLTNEERLAEYPYVVIYTECKKIGGNKCERSQDVFTTITFDQAFDLPEKKDKVEFTLLGIPITVHARDIVTFNVRGHDVNFTATTLLRRLDDAIKELNQQ